MAKKTITDAVDNANRLGGLISLGGFIKDNLSTVTIFGGGIVGIVMSGWAFLESNLPYWAIALVFLFSFAVTAWATEKCMSMRLKYIESRDKVRSVPIKRELLAGELEALVNQLATLLGEYETEIAEAWANDSIIRMGGPPDPNLTRRHREIVAELIRKYNNRYVKNAIMLMRKASKVVHLDANDTWRLRDMNVRGVSDLKAIITLLGNTAVDIRHPQSPLLETDRMYESQKNADT